MTGKIRKKAIVLFNLGGPESLETIRPFLFNFFMDRNIISLPHPMRLFLAWLIAKKRAQNEARINYGFLGGKSPLLENTQAQATALEEMLSSKADQTEYKCFVCMRYWQPMADEVAAQVKEFNPDEVLLLPLYPQFSTTTTRSSFESWDRAARTGGLQAETKRICCYPEQEGFVAASAQNIQKTYDGLKRQCDERGLKAPRLLFSAHGLPEKIIEKGDPYQWQCEQTAKKIVETLNIPALDWRICYQSRVGRLKWIGPSTEKEIRKAGEEKVPLLVYPHAFVSEHVETLVEIEIEFRESAKKYGVPFFERVPTVGTANIFVEGLADLVLSSFEEKNKQIQMCPKSFKQCCQNARA